MFLFLTFIIITTFHGVSRCQNFSGIELPKTCREIFDSSMGGIRDDFHWINPSQSGNAIFARCIYNTRETCVYPVLAQSKTFNISAVKSEVWLVKSGPSYKITYRSDNNQLKTLQEMSESAKQSIRYHCKNVIAYYDSINNNFEKSVKLLGWNNEEITLQNLSNLQFMSGFDDCRHKHNWYTYTDIAYSTNIPSQLPITDIAIRDVGRPGQLLKVHIGPVCFL